MRMTSESWSEAKCAGQLAARFFASHSQAKVVAVFERCLYLEAGRAFVCLGDGRIGDGPINVSIVAGSGSDVVAQSHVGDVVVISEGIATAPGWRLDLRRFESWVPPAWPTCVGENAIAEVIAKVEGIARSMLPLDGLLPLVVSEAVGFARAGVFERLAEPRLARLERWLAAQKSAQAGGEPPVDLLGFGPGLTPSGDDALCGVLLALEAIRSQPAARALQCLASAIERESAGATTALSGQFLSAAIEGQGSAVLHDFVGVLVGGDAARIPAAIEKLARVGHSSGLDAAAGVIIALRAFAGDRRAPRSP